MRTLWAPWRVQYIESPREPGCILCDKPRENRDEVNLILYRAEHSFVIMNLYPYNPGHLMVAPYRHVNALSLLRPEELGNLFEVVTRCTVWLSEAFKPAGFNVGMNLGRVAGAGIEDHIHVHVVPRWNGDTNFMPLLADTKVVSESLVATYRKLRERVGGANGQPG